MALYKVVTGYFAVAEGGQTTFSVSWDDVNDRFSIDGNLDAATDSISRLDFLDPKSPTEAPLAIIPCVAKGSFFRLPYDDQCTFNLQLNSLLGAPSSLAVTGSLYASRLAATGRAFVSNPTLYFSTSSQVGLDNGSLSLSIGKNDPHPLEVNENASDAEYKNLLDGLSKLGTLSTKQQWIDLPQIGLEKNAPTPFGTCFGREFYSDNITCHVRKIDTGSGQPLPVLTIRRQFAAQGWERDTIPFPPPFAFTLPIVEKNNTEVHATQFPSLNWLNRTKTAPGQPLPEATDWHIELSGFPSQSVSQLWSESVVAPYLSSLTAVNDALPLSLLPSLQLPETSNGNLFFWRLCACVTYPPPVGGNAQPLELTTLQLLPGGPLTAEIDSSPYKASATLDAFRTHGGTGLAVSGEVGPALNLDTTRVWQDVAGEAWYERQFGPQEIRFTLQITGVGDNQILRLGALDLAFKVQAAIAPRSSSATRLEVVITFDRLDRHFPLNTNAPAVWFPRVYIIGDLPVFRYMPTGEDALPQTASGALLNDDRPIDKSQENKQDDEEKTALNFRREDPIVLDLSAAVINASRLTVQESSQLSQIASHSQKLVFRLLAPTGMQSAFGPVLVLDRHQFMVARVTLSKTTDATGEEIGVWCNLFPEGPTWRISGGAGGFKLQLPPQAIGEEMERIADPSHPLESNLVASRFSPALTANLLGSFNPQNYVQPAWDLRSVLGYAQQRAPGAGVDPALGIDFELLHGIKTEVVAPNLRLSEMFARLGDFPGPMPTASELARIHPEFNAAQIMAVGTMAGDWSMHYRQLLSRPAVLELYDADQDGPELLLDPGVTCTVRSSALYGATPAPVTPPLRAGVGFALESDNLVAELKRHPVSTAAHLARPRFSALGGWGDQKASFAQGKIIVESHTEMGRLSVLSVTLVGRIGVFWNRALHVTVYERTVRPSRQFFGEQEELRGRPILRKVREYVRLMEPVRAYPESGTSPITRGFVTGSNFKSVTINVDSVWGGDIGASGWRVPLWRPDAAPADVYPRPHINLAVEVDPAVGVPTMLGEVLDPGKLCFYTDTSDDTTSDTDNWPAVPEIDFTDARPVRTVEKDSAPWKIPNGPDPSVEPGFGRFTYHLAPIAGRTNLVAQRTTGAIGASLKNVSMMRGNPVATPPAITPGQQVSQAAGRVRDWWTATVHQLGQALAAKDPAAQVHNILKTDGNAVTGFLAQLQDDLQTVTGHLGDPCGTVGKQLLRGVRKLDASAQTALAQVLTQFSSDLQTQIDALVNQPGTTAEQLEDAVNGLFGSLYTTLAPFTGSLAVAADTVEGVAKTFKKTVDNAAQVLNADDKNLLADVQEFQTKVAFYRDTINGVCRIVVGNAGNQLTKGIPLTLASNLTALAAKLQSGSTDTKDVLHAIQAQIKDLQASLNEPVDLTAAAVTALRQAEPQIERDLTAMQAALTSLIEGQPANLKQALSDFYGQNKILSAKTQAKQITDWVDALLNSASTQITDLCHAFAVDLSKVATGLIDELQGEAANLLSGLTTDANAFGIALSQIEAQVAGQLENVYHQVVASLPTVCLPTFIQPGTALRLLRAFGDAPVVPTLNFALPSLAYFYNETDLPVLMTAVKTEIAQLAQGLDGLSQLGLSMPATGLLDRILPADLTNLNLSDIFPKFAGLDLSGLFSGVTLPDAANHNIHITHKIDPQTRRASLDAEIAIPLAGASTLFDIGPVCLNLLDADLEAHLHVGAGIGQQTTQTANGSITGRWDLAIGGMVLLSFIDTKLSFDESGTLHFAIKPQNVQLAAVLQFVTEFISAFDFGDSGFSLNILTDPTLKVQCILDLPLPDMGGGSFAIMNLTLGALFEIGIDADDSFYITVGANLGRQTAPFDLTIFVLGGAGWFESSLTYTLSDGKLKGAISVGIAASAALDFSLGPIDGSVAIYFGIFANLNIGGGGGLQLGVMILITGQVSLLGLVDINLSLLLEAEYSSAGGLVGRGTIDVSIKICWCFTLSVHEGVEYTFGASPSTSQPTHPNPGPVPAPAPAALAALPAEAPLLPVSTLPPFYTDYWTAAVAYVTMLA